MSAGTPPRFGGVVTPSREALREGRTILFLNMPCKKYANVNPFVIMNVLAPVHEDWPFAVPSAHSR
jgi:hypothetical protein